MDKTTTGEISNLFQELIVSKVKVLIDELGNKVSDIQESESEVKSELDKLGKKSEIKRIVKGENEELKKYIDEYFKKLKMDKYLLAIVEYLKRNYDFKDEKTQEKITLSQYLDSLSEELRERLYAIVESEKEFTSKYAVIEKLLIEYKEEVITAISELVTKALVDMSLAITNSKNDINSQISVGFETVNSKIAENTKVIELCISELGIKFDLTSEERKRIIDNKLNELDAISKTLSSIERHIGTVDDNDSNFSLSKSSMDMKLELSRIQENIQLLESKIMEQENHNNVYYNKLYIKTKMLTVFNMISVVGILLMLMIQFIF